MNKIITLLFILSFYTSQAQQLPKLWPAQRAQEWYDQQGWLSGCNYIPSTAINQLEMWQKETFDTVTINRELGWAQDLGFNTMRVFLHDLAWQQDAEGFKGRMKTFLTIAAAHHIKPFFVFFDDCWNPDARAGKQNSPRPGIHNSGWVRSPSEAVHNDPAQWDYLNYYVHDILSTFRHDKRILMWDLYNEPGNSGYTSNSLPLLKAIFTWARKVNPDQPLTVGFWTDNEKFKTLNTFAFANSDIVSYHCYDSLQYHVKRIDELKAYKRPLVCTEYMARPKGSTFFIIMPLLKRENIGAINWGFVDGKTQTKYAWDTPIPGGAEPRLWFHEILHTNGTPYIARETEFIKMENKR
jgi:hypothetical protein